MDRSCGGKERPAYNEMKANWIGHILRKKRFLKRVIEEKIWNAGRGRRRKQLLDDLRKTRGF